MRLHEVSRHPLNGFGESGGEHESLAIFLRSHSHFPDHLPNRRLEAHIQHPVSWREGKRVMSGVYIYMAYLSNILSARRRKGLITPERHAVRWRREGVAYMFTRPLCGTVRRGGSGHGR